MGRKKKFPKKLKQVRRRKDPLASTSAPPPPPPPWIEMPRDITANILQRLGVADILESAQKVCTTWQRVCQDPAMWRKIDMSDCGNYGYMLYNSEIMVQHAVDRSQGQLLDINIEYFGTDELLDYVAERSSHLKLLRLAYCESISGGGLTEAVKRFPLLEELHLFFTSIPSESIEIVGRSCPLLKSFTLENKGYRFLPECDKQALAVAKAMPELRHLHLVSNKMTNQGLQAILDSCTHLESLDIRLCFHVNLTGDLEKRCSQQIKNLRRPNDFTADHKFDVEHHDFYSSDDYTFGFSDLELMSDYDEYYLDSDDITWPNVGSDYEDIFWAP